MHDSKEEREELGRLDVLSAAEGGCITDSKLQPQYAAASNDDSSTSTEEATGAPRRDRMSAVACYRRMRQGAVRKAGLLAAASTGRAAPVLKIPRVAENIPDFVRLQLKLWWHRQHAFVARRRLVVTIERAALAGYGPQPARSWRRLLSYRAAARGASRMLRGASSTIAGGSGRLGS